MKVISYISDFEEWKQKFHFSVSVRVRFSETDAFGHMNNTIPFVYFEDARIQWFREIGLMERWGRANNDTMIVVADLQCNFLKQVFFGDELNVYMHPMKIGNSSLDLHYMGMRGEDVVFTGRSLMVQASKTTGKSVAFSEADRELLGK